MKRFDRFEAVKYRTTYQRVSPTAKGVGPTGDLFVHIGLPKTGTTAIQASLAASRKHLRELGVLYPGTDVNHWQASLSVTSYKPVGFPHRTHPGQWRQLVSEVTHYRGGPRLISSEHLAYATDDEVDTVIEDLGSCRVLITVKPLERMVPSYWQQKLRVGLTTDLETWCASVLMDCKPLNNGLSTPSALDIGGITQRWAERVGPDNVTVLVVPADHQWLLRQFEQLLGVPKQTLLLTGSEGANRSLTYDEADFLLQLNHGLSASAFTTSDYMRYVHPPLYQMIKFRELSYDELKTPISGEMIELCRQLGLQHIDRIRNLGVHVVGNLDDLAPTSPIKYQNPVRNADAVANAAAYLYSHHLVNLAKRDGSPRPGDIRNWIPPVFMPAARRLGRLYRSLRGLT